MGLGQRSLVFLPFGYESEFPAYLTHRGGLDFGVVDLMRPFDHGGENFESEPWLFLHRNHPFFAFF